MRNLLSKSVSLQKALLIVAAAVLIVFGHTGISAQRLPTVIQTNAMLRQTILDFADAVEAEDFKIFHAKASEDFQATFTPEDLQTSFQSFIDKKELILPALRTIKGKRAQFTKGPLIRTEKKYKILVAKGSFATTPYWTDYEIEYIWTGREWKLLVVKLSM
jgi:hypothetical protein